jgi:hypothetical protein
MVVANMMGGGLRRAGGEADGGDAGDKQDRLHGSVSLDWDSDSCRLFA